MKWHVVATREEHFWGHASGVSQEQIYVRRGLLFLLSSQKIVFCFIKILKNSLVLVVELSYHQYKESSNEMLIKALLQNNFLNASLKQRNK